MRYRKSRTLVNVLTDWLGAVAGWTLFNSYRKTHVDVLTYPEAPAHVWDQTFAYSVALIPLAWLLLYFLWGQYYDVLRRSRINELAQTFSQTVVGVTCIFFIALLDDVVPRYQLYYKMYLYLLFCHFSITALLRFILSSDLNRRIQNRKVGFNTLLIGSNAQALQIFKELEKIGRAHV